MADRVRLACWPSVDRFGIGIQVITPAGLLHSEQEEWVQIDTGYSEALLIPYLLFERLQLAKWQLPISKNPYGQTVTGQLIYFIEAKAFVQISKTGIRYSIIVQTFEGNSRFLIGRALLRQMKVLLDGPGGQTCLLSPTDDEQ